MAYEAKILADSLSPGGHRLTTFQVTFPRIVLAEVNTHCALCLAGDSELEFDMPGKQNEFRRVYKMRLDEFVDKWNNGARRYAANPKRQYDLDWVEPGRVYTAPYVASRMGMSSAANIHKLCRSGALSSYQDGRTWMIAGSVLLAWRSSSPEHTRFDIRSRLAGMSIRQFNEKTGDIQLSRVVNAISSGTKEVYEVIAGDYSVSGSKDHRVLTVSGWHTIGELSVGDLLVVRKFGKREEDKLDPLRLKKIDGVWRSKWQETERNRLLSEDPLCRRCRVSDAVDVHHVEPVYMNPARAFDRDNITFLCDPCHDVMHSIQDWQGGTYLYGSAVAVEEVRFRGIESTYDLEIAGEFPNFLANGVVVHNSRNSASSRAIPVDKRIAAIRSDPFVPAVFGKNRSGMQATEQLMLTEDEQARMCWTDAKNASLKYAHELAEIGVHKQLANRLLEPFAWHTAIITATDWPNFFHLRDNPDAQGEFQQAAWMMRELYEASEPELGYVGWHLPLVTGIDKADLVADGCTDIEIAQISVARCARVSYLTHEGRRDLGADLTLYKRLVSSGHMSPLEHVARPMTGDELDLTRAWDIALEPDGPALRVSDYTMRKYDTLQRLRGPLNYCGKLNGWCSLRSMVPGEWDILGERQK